MNVQEYAIEGEIHKSDMSAFSLRITQKIPKNLGIYNLRLKIPKYLYYSVFVKQMPDVTCWPFSLHTNNWLTPPPPPTPT